jgi:ATP-dependent DNA helicase RecQ
VEAATAILKQYWGYSRFRPLQAEIINHVIGGNNCLALLPTGGGKSLCYQVPSMVLPGLTLVVSPLISLMQDQVNQLQQRGITAAYLHSGLQYAETTEIMEDALYGRIKMLYVSPERLQNDRFLDFLPRFHINFIAVDEAHCISQWGYDFRPEYLQIATIREQLGDVPIIALTASATPEVADDIKARLQINDATVFRKSFDRKNIFYRLQYSENKQQEIVTYYKNHQHSGIVYCRSRKRTEDLALLLRQNDVSAAAYHAGMTKEARQEVQDSWMNGTVPIVVATSAFGMGIDKPDVRSVIHFDVPEHLEAYYQETGRCGRDEQDSEAIMLYNDLDLQRLQDSTAQYFPPGAFLRKVYQSVCEYLQIPIGNQPDDYFDFDLGDFLKKFQLESIPATHALRLLAQEELWSLSESFFKPATVQFSVGRQTLDDLNKQYPYIALVSTGLLRLFSGIFNYPAVIRIPALARHLKLPPADIELALQQMHQMNVIRYLPAKEGPQLHFHHYRVDSRHLHIDHQRIARLRAMHQKRTEYMIAFVREAEACRTKLLLTYFGETAPEQCEHCDNCRKRSKATPDAGKLQENILLLAGQQDGIAFAVLLQQMAPFGKETAALVRSLLDEGILLSDAEGTIRHKP